MWHFKMEQFGTEFEHDKNLPTSFRLFICKVKGKIRLQEDTFY